MSFLEFYGCLGIFVIPYPIPHRAPVLLIPRVEQVISLITASIKSDWRTSFLGWVIFLLSILFQTSFQYRIYSSWRLSAMNSCRFYHIHFVQSSYHNCQQHIPRHRLIETMPYLSILLPSHSLLYHIHSLGMRNTTTCTALLQSILSYLKQQVFGNLTSTSFYFLFIFV